jgi:regulatory protein
VQRDGPLKLRLDLKQRGIDKGSVEDAVQSIDADTELDLARQALGRRAQHLTRTREDRPKEHKRLADFLARRGFGWETTRKVLAEVFSQDPEPED